MGEEERREETGRSAWTASADPSAENPRGPCKTVSRTDNRIAPQFLILKLFQKSHEHAFSTNHSSFLSLSFTQMRSQRLSRAPLEAIPTPLLYKLLQPLTVPSQSPRARFTNWGLTFTCRPLAIFEPETYEQCALILELSRREGRRVRFAGVGHSPSDLACTSEYMLRTTKLNQILEVRLVVSNTLSRNY